MITIDARPFLDYLFILICILYSDFLLYGFVFSSISRYLIFLIAYNLLILSITSDNMNFEFQIIREFNYQNVTIFPNQFFFILFWQRINMCYNNYYYGFCYEFSFDRKVKNFVWSSRK
jgi:hypothetical protein